MARPVELQIVKHVPLESLQKEERRLSESIRSLKKSERLLQRVTFVRMRYSGYSVEEASAAVGFTTKTGYNVQELWNEKGMEGLVPDFKGGPRSRLTEDQKAQLKDMLSACPCDTRTVRLYIRDQFGVEYSEKQVHVILKGMGLRHAKPYPKDYRRPEDAEAVLKKDSRMLWTDSPEGTS